MDNFVSDLWEENLKGGVVLSEYSAFLARDVEAAFEAGAYLSAIITAWAAIESHLRLESGLEKDAKSGLAVLTVGSGLPSDLVTDLNSLRRARNDWVHVKSPAEDARLQENSEQIQEELRQTARLAMKTMIRVFCNNQFI